MFMASLPDTETAINSVMAGLVPAIHAQRKKDVDARHKAGHDGVRAIGGLVLPPLSREAAGDQAGTAQPFG
jgi:hypothetical protein